MGHVITRKQRKAICNVTKAVRKYTRSIKQASRQRILKIKARHAVQEARHAERLIAGLAPVFWQQIKDASREIESGAPTATLAFQPRKWDTQLAIAAAPLLADAYASTALEELEAAGIGLSRMERASQKASTATEYLTNLADDAFSPMQITGPAGDFQIILSTEYPTWMKKSIRHHLDEVFEQDFWQKVNDTTAGDIEGFLHRGAKEGWSVRRVANEMVEAIGGDNKYAKKRGTLIARTELGHTLNAARSESMKALQSEVGQLSLRRKWLSVLGSTTRDTHAHLDGVPEDKNGVWLVGVEQTPARWPSDISLPPHERCNCQCTLVLDHGTSDAQAQQELEAYSERMGVKKDVLFLGPFDSYGRKHLPGQHSQATHGTGGGGRSVGFSSLPAHDQEMIVQGVAESLDIAARTARKSIAGLSFPKVSADVSFLASQVQSAHSPDSAKVAAYRKKLEDPSFEFDPVFVRHGSFYDGGHRVAAYSEAGRSTIPAIEIEEAWNIRITKHLQGQHNQATHGKGGGFSLNEKAVADLKSPPNPGLEHGTFINSGGTSLASMVPGTSNTVVVGEDILSNMKGGDFYHNHPTPLNLSGADIGYAAQFKMRSVTAVGPDGGVYSISSIAQKDLTYAQIGAKLRWDPKLPEDAPWPNDLVRAHLKFEALDKAGAFTYKHVPGKELARQLSAFSEEQLGRARDSALSQAKKEW